MLFTFCLVEAVSVVVVALCYLTAVDGYEDADGFHLGVEAVHTNGEHVHG